MAYWGNTYVIASSETVDLDQSVKKISYRIKTKNKTTVHNVRLLVTDRIGSPPEYVLELRPDKNGYPSDTVLESTTFSVERTGWHLIEAFDYVLEADTYYHLVVYSSKAGLDDFLSFAYVILANNNKSNKKRSDEKGETNHERSVLADVGKGWKEIPKSDVVLVLDLEDGTHLSQAYHTTFDSQEVFGDSGVGQTVLMRSPRTIVDVAFLVRKSDPREPAGDLLFELEDASDGDVVRHGVAVSSGKVTTDYRWYSVVFKAPWTLKINAKYRFSLHAPDAYEDSYYEIKGIETSNELPYRDLRWAGKSSRYIYYNEYDQDDKRIWKERPYQDLLFRATVAPAHILVKPTGPLMAARRSKIILMIILLLLLLQASVVSYFYLTSRTQKVQSFVKRNKDCLVCHPEMLSKLRMKRIHDPFLKRSCTDCHIDHAYSERREKRIVTSETRIKKLTREFCGKTLGISPESRCGQLLGISKEKTTRGTLIESKYIKKYVSIAKPGLKMPQKQLCLSCHTDLLDATHRAYQHKPFDLGLCTSCHDPHASNYINLMVMSDYDLCFSCHGELYPELLKSVQHQPFGDHHCIDCHNPHASDVPAILQDTQKRLCFSCHRDTAQEANRPVQHSPFFNGKCTDCHQAHSGNVTTLLIEPLPTLCYTCHPTIRTDFLRNSHHPLGVPQLKDCLNCHGPHATDFPKLVIAKDNLLCYMCHGDKKMYYDPSAHNRAIRVGVGVCLNCHSPHGTDWYSMLIQPESQICLQCHDPYAYSRYYTDRAHPDGGMYPRALRTAEDRPGTPYMVCSFRVPAGDYVGKPFIDERTGNEMRCTETCHDAHGTANPFMLRWVPDSLCLICHQPLELP